MSEKVILTCDWCLNKFETSLKLSGRPRDSIEYEPLRRILFICDATFEPTICDGCYEVVRTSEPPQRAVATSPNFMLRVVA